jgi:hypothetical protein
MADHGRDDSMHRRRDALFGAKSATDWIREQARRSPYLVIAVSLNLLLVGAATMLQLGREERRQDLAPFVGKFREPEVARAPEPEPEKPDVFGKDAPVVDLAEPEDRTLVEEPAFEMPPDFAPSDKDESPGGDEPGTVLGSDTDSLLGGLGAGWSSIGVGGGGSRSGDGSGPGGRGTGPGGNERLQRRKISSPSKVTEAAVLAGLQWLARHQSEDGSWSADAFDERCYGGAPCDGKGYPEHHVGLTGLALLAFLGAGHDDRSVATWTDPVTGKPTRAGDVVKRGLKWLRSTQDDQGSFSASSGKWGYNHSIATLAMAEAFGLSRLPQWKESAQLAVASLLGGQSSAPGASGLLGWRYRPRDGESDISVTGWCVMALKSAELAGLDVPRGALEGAYEFCREVTDEASGQVGYLRREDAGQQVKAAGKNEDFQNHPALAAVGMLVRTFTRHDVDDPMLEAAARLLAKDLPQWSKPRKSIDFYYWYAGSLALNQFDGPDSPRAGAGRYWKPWNESLVKALVDNQVRNAHLCQDGSWESDDRWGFEGGRVYATAINVLTFEVYYRYGNAFGVARKGGARSK